MLCKRNGPEVYGWVQNMWIKKLFIAPNSRANATARYPAPKSDARCRCSFPLQATDLYGAKIKMSTKGIIAIDDHDLIFLSITVTK